MLDFSARFQRSSAKNKSLLCVGLDPDLNSINPEDVVEFNRQLIRATCDLACAYKPNLHIYDSLLASGTNAIDPTIEAIRELSPDAPIIGDAKRGDIANCGRDYARTMFEIYEFDAVTVNPYMGFDAIEPFLHYDGKTVFVLCRTSNPSGQDLQEVTMLHPESSENMPLYEYVARLANDWNRKRNIGLVVGATYPQQMARLRQVCPDMLFLIPGVGAQGGDISSTVRNAADQNGSGFMINVSRSIMYAARSSSGRLEMGPDAEKRMRQEANRLRSEINQYLPVTASL